MGGSYRTLCAQMCFTAGRGLRTTDLHESPELSEFKANVHVYAVMPCSCRVQPLCQSSQERYVPLDSAITSALCRDMDPDDFDVMFYPGGHGPMEDLAVDENSGALLTKRLGSGRPVALLCHAPAAALAANEVQGHCRPQPLHRPEPRLLSSARPPHHCQRLLKKGPDRRLQPEVIGGKPVSPDR
jgi:putative intracellular protease/amidase